MKLLISFVTLISAISSTAGAMVDYTDDAVSLDGNAIVFSSTSGQDATLVTQEAYDGDLDITAEYLEREIFGGATGGYQAGLTLFFAAPGDSLDTLTGNDNAFGAFEQTSIASVRDKMFPTMDYVWFHLKNLGPDGSLVDTPQAQFNYKMMEGRKFRLVRKDGFVAAYHYQNDSWVQIGSSEELPDAYKTSPLKIGMKIKKEWKSEYYLKVLPSVTANGEQVSLTGDTVTRNSVATTPKDSNKGSSSGDPHFKTWTGDKFDYHGECDLVLLDHPSFSSGLGLRLHIRTTRVKYFSFIEKVALQIGDDILEFDNNVENFLINGTPVEANRKHHKTMLGNFFIRRDKMAISVRLHKEGKAKIDFHTRTNGFPAVIVDGGNTDIFRGSLGLLGDWATGRTLARDGVTEIPVEKHQATEFALEWQTRDHEPMLFKDARAPQYPTVCIPPAEQTSRLGAKSMALEAQEACAHWEEDMDDCIFDVMATRDILVAQEGHIVHIE